MLQTIIFALALLASIASLVSAGMVSASLALLAFALLLYYAVQQKT